MRKLILAAALLLAACAHQSPAADVAALKVALTAAERVGYAYLTLPACPAATLCSDPEISARIKAADRNAYVAVKAAGAIVADAKASPDAVSGTLLAAQTALAALQQILPTQVAK